MFFNKKKEREKNLYFFLVLLIRGKLCNIHEFSTLGFAEDL